MGKAGALKLSAKQKAIVTATGKSLCVSAGAGSGKTLVLVERFAYLVTEKGVSPDRIAAVTYTEKAANNMKERLVKIFTERGLLEERRVLENAYIGTIHGFASRLLKENPAEAGIDPHFTVLESGQADLLMDEVLEAVFEEAAGRPDIFNLLQRYGKDGNLAEAVKAVHAKARSLGKPLAEMLKAAVPDLTGPPSAACSYRGWRAASLARPGTDELWIEFAVFLKQAIKTNQGASKTAQANLEAATRLAELVPGREEKLSWERISGLAACGKQIKARGGGSEWVHDMRERLETLIGLEIEKAGAPFRESFFSLYELFSSRYAALKEESGLLDFDDLLIKAHELFSGEDEICAAVRERYREKFEYVMVDEFQDTNRLQSGWIDRLARADNLFVVGDAKQSIYRFRHADLEAFLEKKAAMESGPLGQSFALNDNYRSRGELLEFINGLFREIWREDTFEFEELAPGKQFPEKKVPSVEFLKIDQEGGGEETKDKARVREARALARRLKRLVEGREIQIADKDGERDVRYGDIAILLRATTDSAIYEKELRDLDIPYFALRARGFYDKQEIADLVNFLVILEKPYLDIPLASVLRSPLAGLSEDALFWLTRVKENADQTPLCEALRRKDLLEPLSPEDAGKLEAFTRLFDDLAGRKDKRRISSILIHTVEKTRYDAKILGKPEGKRKLANVKKLIDMARDFETREAFGLADFVRYVKKLSIQDVRESEAQVELEKGEAVKLLSIHKAKGLEFPVVVAADLGRALNAGESLPVNFTQKNGLGFKIKNEATGSWEEDFGYRKNKEFESVRERQELKRLFYVLLTRAEEHLILSGSAKEKDPEEKKYAELMTWMDWLLKAFENSGPGHPPGPAVPGRLPRPDQAGPAQSGDLFSFKEVPVQKLTEEEGPSPSWGKAFSLAETEPFASAVLEMRPIERALVKQLPGGLPEQARALKDAVRFELKDYHETRDLPVSALLKYDECPGCYFDVYEMRAPEEREEPDFAAAQEEDEARPGLARREFGIIFHRVLQHFDFKNPPVLEIERQIQRERAFLSAADAEELEKSVSNFVNGEWGDLARKSEIHRELPFIYKLSSGQVRGQIDLVIKTPAGDWIIVDYKTGRVASEKELEAKARPYELQILLYALALKDIAGAAGGIKNIRGVLYFTSLDKAWMADVTEEKIGVTRKKAENILECVASAKGPMAHGEHCKNKAYIYG